MSRRKTLQEWQKESDYIHNFEFSILEEPNSGQHVVRVLHKKCGNIIKCRLNNHLKRYCTYCSNKIKKTKEEWQKLSNDIHRSEFSILEEVKNSKYKVKVLHKLCGNIISLTMNNHINHKNGCKMCAKNSLKSHEYWIGRCLEIWGNEYEILEEITNVWNKVKIRHNVCGNIIEKDMSNFIHNKRGCELCNRNYPKSDIKYWQEKLDLFHGIGIYKILESPKNSKTKVDIFHVDCGRIYKTTPSVINMGCGCNICQQSKGSLKISKFLDNNNISYEIEKKFDTCKNIRRLPFDFYLPEYNTCIEFDGIQHFKSIQHFGGEESLKSSKIRDKIKNDFCEKNDIKLIRIKYINIEKINTILWQQLQKNK